MPGFASWARLDRADRTIVWVAALVLAVGLAGNVARVWDARGVGLVVLVSAAAVDVATLAAPRGRSVALGGALAAAAVAGLRAAEVFGGVDVRGPVALVAAAHATVLCAASAVLAVLVARIAPPRVDVARQAGAVGTVAVSGGILVVGAVGLGLLVGDRALGQATALGVAFSVAAVVAIRAATASGPSGTRRRAARVALALAMLAVAFGAVLVTSFVRRNFGLPDRVLLVAHLGGLALVAGAALASAALARRGEDA